MLYLKTAVFQIEWTCVGKEDGLHVLVDDVEVPVRVGKDQHTHKQ